MDAEESDHPSKRPRLEPPADPGTPFEDMDDLYETPAASNTPQKTLDSNLPPESFQNGALEGVGQDVRLRGESGGIPGLGMLQHEPDVLERATLPLSNGDAIVNGGAPLEVEVKAEGTAPSTDSLPVNSDLGEAPHALGQNGGAEVKAEEMAVDTELPTNNGGDESTQRAPEQNKEGEVGESATVEPEPGEPQTTAEAIDLSPSNVQALEADIGLRDHALPGQDPETDGSAQKAVGIGQDSAPIEATNQDGTNGNPEFRFDPSDAASSLSDDTSSSDSDSSDDSDEEDDDYKLLDPEEQARILMQGEGGSDDEGGERKGGKPGAQLRTKNEVAENHVEKPKVEITAEMKVEELGTVQSTVENMLVIKAKVSGEYQVLEAGSVLCLEDRTVIGVVAETLGRVQQPYYSVRFNNSEEILQAGIAIGSTIYYADQYSTYVLTRPLQAVKGSDASNLHDEEVGDDELEFSDDEAEAEHKRRVKQERLARRGARQGAGRGGFSGPSGSTQPSGLNYDDAPSQNGSADDDLYTPLARPSNLQDLMNNGPPSDGRTFQSNNSRGDGQSRGRGKDRGRGGNRGSDRGRGRGNFRGRGQRGFDGPQNRNSNQPDQRSRPPVHVDAPQYGPQSYPAPMQQQQQPQAYSPQAPQLLQPPQQYPVQQQYPRSPQYPQSPYAWSQPPPSPGYPYMPQQSSQQSSPSTPGYPFNLQQNVHPSLPNSPGYPYNPQQNIQSSHPNSPGYPYNPQQNPQSFIPPQPMASPGGTIPPGAYVNPAFFRNQHAPSPQHQWNPSAPPQQGPPPHQSPSTAGGGRMSPEADAAFRAAQEKLEILRGLKRQGSGSP